MGYRTVYRTGYRSQELRKRLFPQVTTGVLRGLRDADNFSAEGSGTPAARGQRSANRYRTGTRTGARTRTRTRTRTGTRLRPRGSEVFPQLGRGPLRVCGAPTPSLQDDTALELPAPAPATAARSRGRSRRWSHGRSHGRSRGRSHGVRGAQQVACPAQHGHGNRAKNSDSFLRAWSSSTTTALAPRPVRPVPDTRSTPIPDRLTRSRSPCRRRARRSGQPVADTAARTHPPRGLANHHHGCTLVVQIQCTKFVHNEGGS
jgi:hypothetical protein